MKILITGASGKVGKHLCESLGKAHDIVAISRQPAALKPSFSPYHIDLVTEQDKLAAVFQQEKPDAVIHLASLIGGACESDPQLAHTVNTEATRQLAEIAGENQVRRFVFFSTAAVYDQPTLAATDETHNVAPQSVYGKSKLAAEAAISELAPQAEDTVFITFRPFNIYGPGFEQSLVYRLIHATPDRPVELFALHNFYRDYVHVSDVVQATTLALDHQFTGAHTIVNIASGVATNTAKLIETLEGHGIHPGYTISGADDPSYSWADITRARGIGYQPKQSLIIDL